MPPHHHLMSGSQLRRLLVLYLGLLLGFHAGAETRLLVEPWRPASAPGGAHSAFVSVAIPRTAEGLAIAVPPMAGRLDFTLDGVPLATLPTLPEGRKHQVALLPLDPSRTRRLVVSRVGGPDDPEPVRLLLGPEDEVRAKAQALDALSSEQLLRSRLPHLVLVVIFLVTAFWHLQLAFLRRQRKENFWMGVVALLMGLRQVGLGGWLEDWRLPEHVLNRLEWVNFLGACMAFSAFMKVLFEGETPTWLRTLQRSFAIPILMVCILPRPLEIWFVRSFGLVWPIPMLVGFVILLRRAYYAHHPDVWMLSGGALVLLAGSIHELGAFLNVWPNVNALGWAFALFLGNMALLFHVRFLRVHEAVEQAQRKLMEELQDRERLSRELHDGIGGELSTAKMMLDSLVRGADGSTALARVPRVGELILECMEDLRSLVWILKEGDSGLLDVSIQLQSRMEHRLGAHGLTLDFHAEPTLAAVWIPASARLHLFRMFQELTTNTLKHANATRVTVRVRVEGAGFHVSYEDNGTGLLEARPEGQGHGLANLRYRAAQMKGDLSFHCQVDQGFKAVLVVPV